MPVYVHDGREALAAIQRDPPDLVLTDLQMPEMNGLELVVAIRTTYPAIPVILMTAHGSEEIAMEALQKGAASFVPKKNLAQAHPDHRGPAARPYHHARPASRQAVFDLHGLHVCPDERHPRHSAAHQRSARADDAAKPLR